MNRAMKHCIVFCHDDFPNIEVQCVGQYTNVTTEGLTADYFDQVGDEEADTNDSKCGDQQELPQIENSNLADSIARLRSEEYGVDDDNNPVPENIPNQDEENNDQSMCSEWNSVPNIFNCKIAGMFRDNPKLKVDMTTESNCVLYIDWFMLCLLALYLEKITEGELLVYFGL